MAITKPKVSQKRMMSGFGSFRSGSGKKGQMGDFFATRSKNPSKVREHTEFATKGSRSRFFKDMDEFATKRSGSSGKYKSFDEFSTRSRSNKYRDFDEFANRRKGAKGPSASRKGNGSKSTFHRKRQVVNSQDTRSARGKATKKEYTPFAITLSLNGGEIQHREPQMGLWGGTIGKRSGKDKRPMQPLPEKKSEEKK
jgi:hypothetical protein